MLLMFMFVLRRDREGYVVLPGESVEMIIARPAMGFG